jgi:hypothetical protein
MKEFPMPTRSGGVAPSSRRSSLARWFVLLACPIALALSGCGPSAPPPPEIKADSTSVETPPNANKKGKIQPGKPEDTSHHLRRAAQKKKEG